MRKKTIALAALLALCLSGLLTTAWAGKSDKRLQFGILYDSPTSDLEDAGQTTELDGALGYQASFEYMATDRVGVEPAVTSAKSDVAVEEVGFPDVDLGEIDFVAVTANVNFHLLRASRLDLSIGPTFGYRFWGDLESDFLGQSFAADDEFIYGLNVGLNVPFGDSRWGFASAVNYLFSDVTLEGSSQNLDVDPLQVRAGASLRF